MNTAIGELPVLTAEKQLAEKRKKASAMLLAEALKERGINAISYFSNNPDETQTQHIYFEFGESNQTKVRVEIAEIYHDTTANWTIQQCDEYFEEVRNRK
jgi:hypothetical protein